MSGTFSALSNSDPTDGSALSVLGLGDNALPLLGLLQGLGQASGTSRLPISIGSVLGGAASGLMQGQRAQQQSALERQQLQAAQLQNELNSALIPGKIQAANALFGGSNGAGPATGVPPMMPGIAGNQQPAVPGSGQPAVPGAAPSGMVPAISPSDPAAAAVRDLISRRNFAQAMGDGRTAAAMQAQLDNIAGPGGIAAPDGSVYKVPGAYDTRYAASYADAAGKVGPETSLYGNKAAIDTSQAGPRAFATANAQAPFQPPITITAPGPNGAMQEQQIPLPDWARNNANQGATPPGTISGIQYVQRVQAAENNTGNPGATNPNSSAVGNSQFLANTWLPLARSEFPSQTQGMTDSEVLAMRSDPQASAAMTMAYARQNALQLQHAQLPVTAATLALAHQFGPSGATSLLQADPNTQVSSVLPQSVISANPNLANQTVRGLLTNNMLRFGTSPVDLRGNNGVGGTAPGVPPLPGYAGSPQAPAIPGAIPGKFVMTPEQSAESTAYGDISKQIIDAGAKAPMNLQRLDILENATQGFRPGASGSERLAAARATTDFLQSIGVNPPAWIANGAASGETIGKEGGFLAADMTRQLGSREAASVFNQVRNIQPNFDMSNGGFQVITNSLRQGIQRDQDLATFREQWLGDPSHGGSIRGMQNAFEQKYPVQTYASRVLPYPLPPPNRLIPNVIYRNPNGGRALWNGAQFVSVDGN